MATETITRTTCDRCGVAAVDRRQALQSFIGLWSYTWNGIDVTFQFPDTELCPDCRIKIARQVSEMLLKNTILYGDLND